jgi:NADH dehydrogenase
MILVAGATGLLGSEICSRLRAEGQAVRAMTRTGSAPDKVAALRALGAATAIADLKDPASLARACEGVETVVSTASSTIPRQEGDSIETVDRLGQLNLVEAAKHAGVTRFIYVSVPPRQPYECPLFSAKQEVAAALEESGMEYTVLLANFFMEVWLSPALGFDYANRRATIYGDGKPPISWVSYRDVAGFAVDAHGNPAVRNRALLVAGPQALSPLEVVRLFEQVTEDPFAVEHVPQAALEKQYAEAMDPMGRTFAALMLGYAHGCPMEMNETLTLLPRRLTTVRDYAAAAGRNT